MPRTKNIIKMKFRRDLSDAKITLWVAPEFEDLMKRLSREKAGEAESIKESQNWRNPDGTPLQFYINAKDDVERELLKDCENVRNNYGASLIDREGYGLSANVALVRTVGASVGKGIEFSIDENVSIEDLQFYCETVAQWATKLYEKYMQVTNFEATISYII